MRQRFDQFPQLYRPKQNCETSKMKQLLQLTQLLKTKLKTGVGPNQQVQF